MSLPPSMGRAAKRCYFSNMNALCSKRKTYFLRNHPSWRVILHSRDSGHPIVTCFFFLVHQLIRASRSKFRTILFEMFCGCAVGLHLKRRKGTFFLPSHSRDGKNFELGRVSQFSVLLAVPRAVQCKSRPFVLVIKHVIVLSFALFFFCFPR